MDRFIDGFGVTKFNSILCLKSNMDRFIAHTPIVVQLSRQKSKLFIMN